MKSPRYYRTDTAQRQSDFSGSTHSRKSPGYGNSFMQASKSPAQLKADTTPLQMKENPLQLAQEEDELQMKKNPLQMAQEEDELQMKKNPLQLAQEEDELQMKKGPAQKKESQAATQAPRAEEINYLRDYRQVWEAHLEPISLM
ncbi:hypothetical protein GXP67_29585 [Rhodocytophaga rosea]|uniref:Uncharacterized protein n=1 Tax=Rhodocytophaga rosea TaxID=2704465 RepID=A0A6C0GR16_9BACT|nr:hypothetical protein [Rhodocytophaga rosea]QHT70509.1 hypothetical protein GXP67_29585 [Rhodocytophaga rosea]